MSVQKWGEAIQPVGNKNTESEWDFESKKAEVSIAGDGSSAELSASASAVIIKATGSIDLWKAFDAVFDDDPP